MYTLFDLVIEFVSSHCSCPRHGIYRWGQTRALVHIFIAVPDQTRAKDVSCIFHRTHIHLIVDLIGRGRAAGEYPVLRLICLGRSSTRAHMFDFNFFFLSAVLFSNRYIYPEPSPGSDRWLNG